MITVHTNIVSVKGDDVTVNASDSFKLIEQNITKSFKEVRSDNTNLPIFLFDLTLSGVNSNSLTITDAFDTTLFNIYTSNQYYFGVGKGDQTWDATGTDGGSVTATTGSDGKVTLNVTNLAKKDDNSYYNYYVVHYALQAKDANALATIKQNAANSNGTYEFDNTATWGEHTSTAKGQYTINPLDKTVTTNENGETATYTVTINSDKLKLNNGNSYTVNDAVTIESGSGAVIIDPTSVNVTSTDPSDKSSEVNCKVNSDLRSMSITVPDETKVVVTYSASVISSGTFSYSNTVSYGDHYSKKSDTKTFTNSQDGSGTAETYRFTFEKLDEDEQTKKLSGAVYQLYELNSDGTTWNALKKRDESDVTFTTDSNGQFTVESQNTSETGWTILAGHTYKLVETQAPSGYQIGAEKTFTVLSRLTNTDTTRTDGIYNGTTTYLYDKKGTDLTTDFTVSVIKKVTVSENSSSKASDNSFSFELYKSDENKTCNSNNKIGSSITINTAETDINSTSTSNATAFSAISGLKVGTYYYAVKETVKSENGWTNDDTVHLVKLTVSKDDSTNTLTKTVEVDGNQVNDASNVSVEFTNTYNDSQKSVTISKKAVNGSDELAGAHIQILNGDTVVTEWDSTTTAKVVSGLSANTTYTLRETVAPEGYTIVSDSTFTIAENGTITTTGTVQNTNGVLLINDSLTSVKISKTNITGDAEIAGAELQILKSDGTVIQTWTSTSSAHEITGLKTGELYTLREKTAPNGYVITTDTQFKLNADGTLDTSATTTPTNNNGVLLVKDAATVQVSKVDATNQQELTGAHIQVLDSNNNVVDEWDSQSGTKHSVTGIKVGETYTLHETVAPTGYTIASDTTFFIDVNGNVTTTAEKSSDGTLLVQDTKSETPTEDKGKIVITKTIEGDVTKEEAEGALKFKVTNNSTNVSNEYSLKDFTYDANTNKWSKEIECATGTYTVEETVTDVAGHTLKSVTYKIDYNEQTGSKASNVTVNKDTSTNVEFKDTYESKHDVTIKKTDVGGKEIEGAKLTIKDSNDKLVEEWTSIEGQDHIVKLEAGTYTLTETTAPKGYEQAESITFTVTEDGKVKVNDSEVTEVTMVDKYSDQTVEISKTDVGGKEVEGAKLTVKDSEGKEVTSWTSTKETKKITVQPGTYTLHEDAAPNGYKVSNDVTFTVDKDGNVTVDGKKVTKVTMIDEYQEHTVTISKTDVGGKELEGAKLTLKDSSGKLVEEWTSTKDSHIVNVKPGTYTLHEDTAPAGYKVTNDITFVVSIDGTVTVNGKKVDKITMVDESKESKTADTSDKNNPIFYAGMLAIALSGMIIILAKRKMDLNN